MSDRTYTWFAVPVTAVTPAVLTLFSLTLADWTALAATTPESDDATGQDGISLRLVDGVPCLVREDTDANYGGSAIEAALTAAGVPYLQRNNAGIEYGPSRTVHLAGRHQLIRTDPDGEPIAGLRLVDGVAVVDDAELRDLEAYHRLRQQVLAT